MLPDAQVRVGAARESVSEMHWLVPGVPLPVQAGLEQVAVPFTVVATHWLLAHWLLFVQRQ
jgi:hypothetical protein